MFDKIQPSNTITVMKTKWKIENGKVDQVVIDDYEASITNRWTKGDENGDWRQKWQSFGSWVRVYFKTTFLVFFNTGIYRRIEASVHYVVLHRLFAGLCGSPMNKKRCAIFYSPFLTLPNNGWSSCFFAFLFFVCTTNFK